MYIFCIFATYVLEKINALLFGSCGQGGLNCHKNQIEIFMKQLKLNGFREEILVTVYLSHMLSHIGHGSPLFISATAAILDQMERAQPRAFHISELVALEKYNIGTKS